MGLRIVQQVIPGFALPLADACRIKKYPRLGEIEAVGAARRLESFVGLEREVEPAGAAPRNADDEDGAGDGHCVVSCRLAGGLVEGLPAEHEVVDPAFGLLSI